MRAAELSTQAVMRTNKKGFLHSVYRVKLRERIHVIRWLFSARSCEHTCVSLFQVSGKHHEGNPALFLGHGDAHIHEEGACPTHRDHPVPDSQCAVSVRRAPFCDARDVDSLKNKQTDEFCAVLLLLSRKETQEGQRGWIYRYSSRNSVGLCNTLNVRLSANATVCNAVMNLC